MAARKTPTVPRRALAAALERHREQAGLSREDVQQELGWSAMKPYRIETARTGVDPDDVTELANLYKLDDTVTAQLVALARQAKRRGWWNGMSEALPAGFSVHLDLESTARAIRMFADQFVPGLWQTEDLCPRRSRGAVASAAPPSRSSGRSRSGCAARRSW